MTFESVLELAVESLGFDARSAPDGQEAWDLFQAEGADVIISDWRMPRSKARSSAGWCAPPKGCRTSIS